MDKICNRIDQKLKTIRETGKKALILYITPGFPDIQTSQSIFEAVSKAGADIIEIGVPFSDPLADGPSIQKSSFHAIRQGVTLHKCIDFLKQIRSNDIDTPIIFMGYFNPILQYGLEAFTRDASDAGLDGLIVPDLPTEEAMPLNRACEPYDIEVIPLLAPTSTDARIKAACANARGFIYCISFTGVTGARRQISSNLSGLVNRIRKYTNLPIMIGFGISNRSHVKKMEMFADGVVVGSALVNIISEAPKGQEVNEAIKFVQHLKGN